MVLFRRAYQPTTRYCTGPLRVGARKGAALQDERYKRGGHRGRRHRPGLGDSAPLCDSAFIDDLAFRIAKPNTRMNAARDNRFGWRQGNVTTSKHYNTRLPLMIALPSAGCLRTANSKGRSPANDTPRPSPQRHKARSRADRPAAVDVRHLHRCRKFENFAREHHSKPIAG